MTRADELPTARDRNRMLIEAGLALSAELDLDSVLRRIVELAAQITGARYGALAVIGEDRRIARFITTGLSDEEATAMGDPPVGRGLLGALIEEGRTVLLDDIAADPRAAGFPANHPDMHSFLGTPIRALGRVFGNIYLTEKTTAPAFDEDDAAALEVLATQAGVAIENARLYEETTLAQKDLGRLELLEERERIAKELHDGVIQSLFAVGMGLQGAAAMANDRDLAGRLENAVDDIDRAIRDLRNYIFGLRPGILADRQLDQALRVLCLEFEGKSGVIMATDIDEQIASELASVATDVIQLAREALSNVGRHARATTCRVSLKRSPDGRASLVIDDDGVGFDPMAPGAGMGLENLRGRVSAMGGELSISSSSGEGTNVTALLPLT